MSSLQKSTYKILFAHKYELEQSRFSVIKGFLYFFGFNSNPYIDSINNRLKRSDLDALKSDWNTIGQDFKRVLENNNLPTDACK